jgi:hypothetical protein
MVLAEARSVGTDSVEPARAEQVRARVLDRARTSGRAREVTRRAVVWALAAGAAAMTATVVALLRMTPQSTERAGDTREVYRGAVRSGAGARFTLDSGVPDEVVRLVDGTIGVTVAPLASGDRFRVVVGDAEVEVRGTEFEVSAHDDRIGSVHVVHGLVELRMEGREPVVLSVGETWARDAAADVETEVETTAAEDALAEVEESSTAELVRRGDHREAQRPRPESPSPGVPSAEPETWTAASGFEVGWAAMRRGDYANAAVAFGDIVVRAPADPIAEDASFWRAVALSRVPDDAAARAALAEFVGRYPHSMHAPEAAVMLGWSLRNVGDLAGARSMFERGVDGSSERVRASAARGLAALDR